MPEYKIKPDGEKYKLETGPLEWTEAHQERDRMMRAEKERQQFRKFMLTAAIIVFFACMVAGYFIGINL